MKQFLFTIGLLASLSVNGQSVWRNARLANMTVVQTQAAPSVDSMDDVSGLFAWYKFDSYTGSDNDGMVGVTNSVGTGDLPTATWVLKTAAKNGKNVGWFDGTTNFVYRNTFDSGAQSQPYTMFFVFKADAVAQNPVAFWWNGGQLQVYPGGKWDMYAGTDVSPCDATTDWVVMGIVFNGASSYWRTNGGAWTSFNPGTGALSAFQISGYNGNAGHLQMSCGEVGIYTNAISTAAGNDGDKLFDALNTKWAVY